MHSNFWEPSDAGADSLRSRRILDGGLVQARFITLNYRFYVLDIYDQSLNRIRRNLHWIHNLSNIGL